MGTSSYGGLSASSTDWGIISLGGVYAGRNTGKGFECQRVNGNPIELDLRSVDDSVFIIVASVAPI